MDTILVFRHVDAYGARLRLEGIYAFAHEVNWNVQSYEERFTEQDLKALRDFWHPVGTILSPNDGRDEYDAALFSPDDTVLLDSFPPNGLERFPAVITDSFSVTEVAARELIGSQCACYGFVPWLHTRIWSENRRLNFARILAREGLRLHEFRASNEDIDVRRFQQELMAWLKALPKPCGILAANDRVGDNVLRACHLADISVPFDCRVVGIDDNATVCNDAIPSLSSVGLDFKQSGYKAAQMLFDLIHGKPLGQPIVSIPPFGFTRRGSSRVFHQTDRLVLKASELIRAKACDGLQARDVLALFPGSRRLAEIRFRKATGHSVLDEIQAVRIEHAKKLLRNPYQRLDAVAEQCGYASDTTFRRIFKKETGQTLREWQKSGRSRA